MRFLFLLFCFVLYAPIQVVHAHEILSCQISGQEDTYLRLTETEGRMSYAFGVETESKPLVAFNVPLQQVVYRSWVNPGQSLGYLVVLRQGEYVYSVYASYDEWSGLDSTGVTVEHKEVFLADHNCHYMSVRGNLVAYIKQNLPE